MSCDAVWLISRTIRARRKCCGCIQPTAIPLITPRGAGERVYSGNVLLKCCFITLLGAAVVVVAPPAVVDVLVALSGAAAVDLVSSDRGLAALLTGPTIPLCSLSFAAADGPTTVGASRVIFSARLSVTLTTSLVVTRNFSITSYSPEVEKILYDDLPSRDYTRFQEIKRFINL